MKLRAKKRDPVVVAVVVVIVLACTLARRGTIAFLLRRPSCRSTSRSSVEWRDAGGDSGATRRRARCRPLLPTSEEKRGGGGTVVSVVVSSRLLLAYYPSDETLSERLKNVGDEWDNVRREGIGKFLSDEFELAERLMHGNAEAAVREANDAMERGGGDYESSSSGDDYLLKEGFHAMATAGERLAGEIRAVRQELDVSRAARGVEGAAEDVVGADVLVERDLARVVDAVVSSLKEADEVVQSALAAVASRGGLTDSTRGDLAERLEDKARDIEESIKAADSVAILAKEIAAEDRRVMSELERTGDRLSDAIEKTESLTNRLRGAEGGADVDSVSDTVGQTVAIVREFERAAEDIADAVGQKVIAEADAVMAMDEKAADSADAVRAAEAAVRDSSDPSSGGIDDDVGESLRAALTKNAEEIRGDRDTAERLAEAIRMDATNDEGALRALESGSREVDSLMDAVGGAVDKAADSVAGGASGSSVAEAVNEIEEEIVDVEESMSDVKKAAEKCQDCNVKEIAEEIEESKSFESSEEDEDVEGDESEVEDPKKQEEEEVRSEDGKEIEVESDVEEETDDESRREVEPSAHEKEQDIDVSSSEIEEESVEITMSGKDESSDQLQGPGGESMHEAFPETIASVGGDDGHSGEELEKMLESATNALPSMTDAVAEPDSPMSGDFANDALVSADPPEGFENIVSSTASVASEVSESAHDMATWTAEAMTEAVAIFSSFFI